MTGQELIELRQSLELKQNQMAKMLGISQQNLCYYERKKTVGHKLEGKINKIINNNKMNKKIPEQPEDKMLTWFWKLKTRKEYYQRNRF